MTAFAPSGSARIAYDDEGAGPPVLLLHAGVTEEGTAHVPQLEGHARLLEAIRDFLT